MLEMFKAKPNERNATAQATKADDPGRPERRGSGLMLAANFTLSDARDLVYLVAVAGFILALKGLGSPRFARRGNQLGALAALAAVAITFTLPALRHSGKNLALALIAMALGAVVAVPVARMVKMTAMPQLVAIFNGVGGGAAALIAITELLHLHDLGDKPAVYVTAEVLLGSSSARSRSRGAPSPSSSSKS